MDLIFKSPTDKIWIDIYRCPDLVERMLLDDGGAGVSPDNAGVWHLSITFTRQGSAGDGAAVAVKEEDTNN